MAAPSDLDEAFLQRMLAEVGEGIPVAEQGPTRIIAARDRLAATPSRLGRATAAPSGEAAAMHGRRARTLTLVGVAAAVLLVVIGVGLARGGGGRADRSATARSLTTTARPSPGTAASAAGGRALGAPAGVGDGSAAATGSASSPAPSPAPAPATLPPASHPSSPAMPTRVVKTGQVALEVPKGQVQAALGRLTADAGALGGFVAASSSSDVPGGRQTGTLTLRVPAAAFDALVADVRAAGTATSVTTSGQDVTAQYVDLQARIASLTTVRTQYQQILAKATAIGDILSVESQLSDVQTQIEQLQGQLDVLADQATASTLTVQVSEAGSVLPPAPRPVHRSGISQAWAHARATFVRGVEAVIGATGGIAVFALTTLVLVAAGRLAWVLLRRRML